MGDEAEASGGRGLDADRLFAGVGVGVRTVADFVLGLLLCMSCAWRRADARARIGVCAVCSVGPRLMVLLVVPRGHLGLRVLRVLYC